jgi:hypothetical protein
VPEIDHAVAVAPKLIEKSHEWQGLRCRLHRQGPQYALRSSGRTGGIEHRGAKRLVGDRRCRVSRRRLVEILHTRAVAFAIGDEAKRDVRTVRQRRHRDATLGFRRDQNLGFAVVENVGELVRRQKRIDARVIEARARAGATAFDIARIVLHEDGIVIETAQALRAQQMGQPIAPRFQFGVGDGLTGLRHDEGRLPWAFYETIARIHGPSPRLCRRLDRCFYSSSVAVTGTWSDGLFALR